MSRLRPLLLLLFATVGALLAGAVPVSAHAALTGSDPQQGSVVQEAPGQVSLTFSEKVAMSDGAVRVYDPKGKEADTGEVTDLGGNSYAVELHSGLPDGTFTVTYQVVSADSHPVSGAFTFSVGAPSKTTVAVPEQEVGGGIVGGLYGFARYLSYAGFILLVGGAAFVLACWQRGAGVRPVQRLVVSGWLTLTTATLAMLLLRGSYTGSGKLGDVFDLDLLGQVLQTKTGAALVSRLLLLAAAALFIAVLFGAYARRDEEVEDDGGAVEVEGGGEAVEVPRARSGSSGDTDTDTQRDSEGDLEEDSKDGSKDGSNEGSEEGSEEDSGDEEADDESLRRDLTFGLAIGGGVVSAGLAASWAMAEHASTGIQTGISMPLDILHLLAVAAWLGGLATLLVALFRAPVDAQIETDAVRRFSRVAFGSVLVLTATGIYQSWRQVGTWSALTGTSYGQLLLVKVGLVAVLVGIAWISRRWTAQLAEAPAVVEAEAVVEKEPAATHATGGSARGAGGGSEKVTGEGSERAAQLARQQAAVASAREQRIRNADPGRTGLRRSVLAEAGVAVVLLAVTTVLTSAEPGRTVEEAKAANAAVTQEDETSGALALDMSFDTGGKNGQGVARLQIDPARVGANEMHVYVQRPDGKPFDVPEVKVAFTLEAKEIGPLPVVPDRVTTGHWTANGVQIPMAGNWKIEITVRTSEIDQVTVSKNAKIG
ncbi:copper resistance CopC/CopD family protein [Streptomyces europaeiscabiei]|uniref:Copper resistance protein CopC n=1 Tax=Streptomyces europaeiscabiei TaxID=146819 RepID=A0ABU4NI85_9ACTN|nr:copper resistance protein CopC [Streptomyces europaeiscabiei]MDX2527827.1 copper resistance protein CopC [Streptomyces europaeiscabiei]MDX2757459.1 copper resistance protein CopC [Streptomyces europaeiscabiei]MDX3544907.1 copper resistance protein CopC [Streptomyces europaeiscabiei]MDX3554595.1 copper resistance protein CopC [Streptomyces europaeiscabiei]MDX3702503.1 copper resistance protein CopC [Streptomyces europaeiscabiei]